MKKAKYGSGFKLFDYYKTVARVGGVFSALSLAAMIYVIYYMFSDYILGNLKEELAVNAALKYSLIVLGIILAAMVVVFVAFKIASKRTSALDVALIVVGIADIVIMVKEFAIDGVIRNYGSVLIFAIPLACTVVISIVRWIIFSPRRNKLISTHGEKSNSDFKSYYKDLFKRPSTWFMIVAALVVSLMFVLAQKEGWLGIFDLNESAKNEMIRNCATMGGLAGILFLIGLAIRLYNKTLNFMDAYSFALAPAGVMMIISYAIVQHTATLILAIGALIISAALQILYAKTSYLTDSIVCDEEEITVEEEAEEEKTEEAEERCVADECKSEVVAAVAEIADEHEDYGATIEAVQRTLDRLYNQNAELEERLEKAEEALRAQTEKTEKLEKEVGELKSSYRFVLLDIEKLLSRLSYLETNAGRKKERVVVKTDGDDKAFVMRALENIISRLTYAESLIGKEPEKEEKEESAVEKDYPFIMLTLEKLLSRLTYAETLLANGVVPVKEEEKEEQAEEPEEPVEEVAEPEEEPEETEEEGEEEEESIPSEPVPEGEITWEEVASNKRRA